MKPIVDKLKRISSKIVLFGSCATGEDIIDSDIDLFILTRDVSKIKNIFNNIRFDRKIQPVIVNSDDLIRLKEQDKAFFNEMKKGVILWDENNE